MVNLDGMIYVSIVCNMVDGVGLFWKLYFIKMFFLEFYEYLLFMMFLELFVFWLFGDFILVEKGFFFVVMLCVVVVWWWLWNWLNVGDLEYILVVLFMFLMVFIVGCVGWVFVNGMLENVVIFLIFFGVLFVVEIYVDEKGSFLCCIVIMIFVGFLVFCVFLIKVSGFFVFGVLGFYWFVF